MVTQMRPPTDQDQLTRTPIEEIPMDVQQVVERIVGGDGALVLTGSEGERVAAWVGMKRYAGMTASEPVETVSVTIDGDVDAEADLTIPLSYTRQGKHVLLTCGDELVGAVIPIADYDRLVRSELRAATETPYTGKRLTLEQMMKRLETAGRRDG